MPLASELADECCRKNLITQRDILRLIAMGHKVRGVPRGTKLPMPFENPAMETKVVVVDLRNARVAQRRLICPRCGENSTRFVGHANCILCVKKARGQVGLARGHRAKVVLSKKNDGWKGVTHVGPFDPENYPVTAASTLKSETAAFVFRQACPGVEPVRLGQFRQWATANDVVLYPDVADWWPMSRLATSMNGLRLLPRARRTRQRYWRHIRRIVRMGMP